MAAYNFQKRYVPLIESGQKCQTIRMRRKNGYLPRSGDVLRLYQGMRTKACKLICEVCVTEVLPICVHTGNGCADVTLNNERLSNAQILELVKHDGFKDVRDFSEFFNGKYGPDLHAYLIQWDASMMRSPASEVAIRSLP